MIYRGYEITASAKTYLTWSLNDEGDPVEVLGRDDGEIGGYFARHIETGEELDFIEGKRVESAKYAVDEHLAQVVSV
jgi:hypothetical protein